MCLKKTARVAAKAERDEERAGRIEEKRLRMGLTKKKNGCVRPGLY